METNYQNPIPFKTFLAMENVVELARSIPYRLSDVMHSCGDGETKAYVGGVVKGVARGSGEIVLRSMQDICCRRGVMLEPRLFSGSIHAPQELRALRGHEWRIDPTSPQIPTRCAWCGADIYPQTSRVHTQTQGTITINYAECECGPGVTWGFSAKSAVFVVPTADLFPDPKQMVTETPR
jgi:hypothetical protein